MFLKWHNLNWDLNDEKKPVIKSAGRRKFPAEETAHVMALRKKKVAGVARAQEGEMNDTGRG